MLDRNTINQMNIQIQRDLRTLNSIISSPEDREEARKNIAVLTEILNPQEKETPEPQSNGLVNEICSLLRDRRR